jgi:ATP-dependent exoDNAse (exonuclease V) alpha subunit
MGPRCRQGLPTGASSGGNQWARDAVKDFQQGRAREAIAAYAEHGHFHLADSRPQAMAQLIEQWKADGGVSRPDSVLMLASLNSEVKELNLRAQAERIRAGLVECAGRASPF